MSPEITPSEITPSARQLAVYLGLLERVTGQPVPRYDDTAVRLTRAGLEREVTVASASLIRRVAEVGRSYGAHLVYDRIRMTLPPGQSVHSWLERGANRTATERASHAFQDWLDRPAQSTSGSVLRAAARGTTRFLRIATASRDYAAWSTTLASRLLANQERVRAWIDQPIDSELLRALPDERSNIANIARRITGSPTLMQTFVQSMREGAAAALLPLDQALDALRLGNRAEPNHIEALQLIESKGINTHSVPRLTVDGQTLPDPHTITNADSEIDHLVSRRGDMSRAVDARIKVVQGVQELLLKEPSLALLMAAQSEDGLEIWSADQMETALGSQSTPPALVREAIALAGPEAPLITQEPIR